MKRNIILKIKTFLKNKNNFLMQELYKNLNIKKKEVKNIFEISEIINLFISIGMIEKIGKHYYVIQGGN